MGMYGGGGSSDAELGNWGDEIRPYWQTLLSQAQENANDPYQSYFASTGNFRTPGVNSDQLEAMQYTRNMARAVSSPVGAMDGARSEIEDTLGGDYLNANPFANRGNLDNVWTNQFRNNYLTQDNPWANAQNQYAGQQNAWSGLTNPNADDANQYTGVGNSWADRSAEVGSNSMLASPFQNPYSTQANEFTGLGNEANPYSGQSIDPGTNQYAGDSPQFRAMLQQGMEDIANTYQMGTAADTQRAFAQGGAFGGSAYQQAVANNQSALAKQLTNYATGMQNSQYDRSAGLQEAQLGRSMDAQKFGTGLGSQNYENALNRAFQGQEAQYGRGFGSAETDIARRFAGTESAIDRALQNQQFDKQLGGGWEQADLARWNQNVENQIGRGFQASESYLGRGSDNYNRYLDRATQADEARLGRGYGGYQAALDRGFQSDESLLARGNEAWMRGQDRGANAWDAERGRMMGAIPLGQNEQNLAYQRIGGLMGTGDFLRGTQREMGDEMYQDWFNNQNWARNQNAWLAGILSGAQGGLPPSQMTPGASPWANALGTGLAAYGMFRG